MDILFRGSGPEWNHILQNRKEYQSVCPHNTLNWRAYEGTGRPAIYTFIIPTQTATDNLQGFMKNLKRVTALEAVLLSSHLIWVLLYSFYIHNAL